LFRIAAAEAADLDQFEGLGQGYRKGASTGRRCEHKNPATAYFAMDKDPRRLPYHWYKDFVFQAVIRLMPGTN
jgi:hypothetical protein